MRIISGKYKGREVLGYTIDGTRPTMDRVKESLIGMIQNNLEDSICLDLFTGSGSVGLEFLSNGAKECFFVDCNYKAIETLKKNINKLNVQESTKLINSDYKEALNKIKNSDVKLDIIFLDPPYEMNLITPAIKLIKECDLLNNNGIIICEYEKEKIDTLDFKVLKERRYGSKSILILKKISE